MTHKQALRLQEDWGKDLEPKDFNETLYVSIKGIGTKVLKNCFFHEDGNYMFIWTKNESFLLNRKELGDFVMVPYPTQIMLSTKKKKKVT